MTAQARQSDVELIDRLERLKVSEIFYSLQGEAIFSGRPTVFVRLTGCPLRCQYCDTAYAFSGGEWLSVDGVLDAVAEHQTDYVCVTGGEPLAQANCLPLLARLCDAGNKVSLETSGALDIGAVDPRVSRIVDIKTPASTESARNLWSNLDLLQPHDALKFVICDRADFDWSVAMFEKRSGLPCPIFFSPSYDELPAATLADWILQARLPVRLQLQLHKLLWGDVPGR